MASTEDLLLELADTVAKDHNLSVEAMFKLADTLDELHADATVPYTTFHSLVDMLSDTDCVVPYWLAASEGRLEQYKENQFNALVKLVEARHWLGDAKRLFEQFWAWQIVFALPRHVHRQMADKRDWKKLVGLKSHLGRFRFTSFLPKNCYEEFPDSYKILREICFPNGIDDAIPAFIKHFHQVATAVRKLKNRITALEKDCVISRDCKLYIESQDLITKAEPTIGKIMLLAQRWHTATKKQKEYFQLPGVSLGLCYSKEIFAEFESNKAFILHLSTANGTCHWDAMGPLYTPLRWRPGSVWLDFFRNIKQDNLAMRHIETKEMGILRDESEKPGPFEMRLPQSIVNIWMYYGRMYATYEDRFDNNKESLPSLEKSEGELAKQAKRLSKATGEPYWHVREIRIDYGRLDMRFAANPDLAGRPRFDALGNLRLDYMGSILKELKRGRPLRDHRTQQSMALLRADCDDKTEMGKDLEGSI